MCPTSFDRFLCAEKHVKKIQENTLETPILLVQGCSTVAPVYLLGWIILCYWGLFCALQNVVWQYPWPLLPTRCQQHLDPHDNPKHPITVPDIPREQNYPTSPSGGPLLQCVTNVVTKREKRIKTSMSTTKPRLSVQRTFQRSWICQCLRMGFI